MTGGKLKNGHVVLECPRQSVTSSNGKATVFLECHHWDNQWEPGIPTPSHMPLPAELLHAQYEKVTSYSWISPIKIPRTSKSDSIVNVTRKGFAMPPQKKAHKFLNPLQWKFVQK